VTHRPTARQCLQHTCDQQYRSSVFCDPCTDRCYATHAKHILMYAVTSHSNREAVFCCGPCWVVVGDNRSGVFYVVCAMPSAGQWANRHAFWHVMCVSCAVWSVPQLYKGASLKDRQSQENENTMAYNRVQQNENWAVSRREPREVSCWRRIEVSLWRLSVWLEDLFTVRLF
jgi:hypothetical protein